MIEFLAIDYAFYVYGSFLSFITVVIICTNNAVRYHKKTLDHIKNTIIETEQRNNSGNIG